MLRNWSEVVPAGAPNAAALISGTEYVGLTGAEILAATGSGDHGAGIFVPWEPEPGNRYRAVVTSLTGGPLRLAEDGSGDADAAFEALLAIYENNLLVAEDVALSGVIALASATVSVAAAATAQLLATAGAQVSVAIKPPVDVIAAATAQLLATMGAGVSAEIKPTVHITGEATAQLLATMGAEATTGIALPPLTGSTFRVVSAARPAPVHLQPLDVGEIDDLVFDFSAKAPAGDQVQTVSITCEARVGEHTGSTPLLYGLPQIQGNKVLQRVRGDLGLAGVTYLLRGDAVLASGKSLIASAFLKVVRLA